MDLSPAIEWIEKRELARRLKETGCPGPFSPDPILAAYRFCNVRREDDSVTVWIRKNIRKPFADHPHLWLMLCIARQINWPDTLDELVNTGAWPDQGEAPWLSLMAQILDRRKSEGKKNFTGAYIIPAPHEKGSEKSTYLRDVTIGMLWKYREKFDRYLKEPSLRMRAFHHMLTQYMGWGPFLAYQAVVDMRFCPNVLGRAEDIDKWCAAGPGTLRGLNRLKGRPLDETIDQHIACQMIVEMWPRLVEATGVQMDLSDVPNVLCETDKFLRVRNGQGKPRASYVPGRGY